MKTVWHCNMAKPQEAVQRDVKCLHAVPITNKSNLPNSQELPCKGRTQLQLAKLQYWPVHDISFRVLIMNLSRISTASAVPCLWTHGVGNLAVSSRQICQKHPSCLLTCLCFFKAVCRAASSALRSARGSLSLQTPSATASVAEALCCSSSSSSVSSCHSCPQLSCWPSSSPPDL